MSGIAARLLAEPRQEHVARSSRRIGVERIEVALAPQPLAGRHRQVEGAVDEVGGGEGAGDRVAVAQAQQGDGAQVAARRVAADRRKAPGARARRSPRAAATAPRPRSRRAPPDTGARARAGSRRSTAHSPVASASSTSSGSWRSAALERPAAAVDVQVRADGGLLGRDHPQPHRPRPRLDRDVPRALGRKIGAGKMPPPSRRCAAGLLDRHLVGRRVGGELSLELGVERPRLGEHVIGHGSHGPIL